MSSLIKTKVNMLLEAAIQRHQGGQLEAANLLYEEIRKIDPNNVNALQLSGLLAYQVKQYDDALVLLSTAISIKSDHVQALIHRALVFNELGRLEDAINDLNKVVLIEPNNWLGHFHLAMTLRLLGRVEDALVIYNKVISLKPNEAMVYNNRGNLLYSLGKTNDALADLDRAILLNREYADAYFNRGVLLYKRKQMKEALADFENAVCFNPNDPIALLNRGTLRQELFQREGALADYSRAIELKPDYVDALTNRASVLIELDKTQDALDDINKAISLNPENHKALTNRSGVLRHLGRFEEALIDADKSISLDQAQAKSLNNRGAIYHDLSRFEEALSDYDKALSIDPEDPATYFNKAQLLLLLKDFKSAWPLYEWRFKSRIYQDQNYVSEKPIWSGEKNKHVFVWSEQGIGDEIMYSSIIAELAAVSSELTIRCDRRLIPLFERSFPKNIRFLTKQDPVENVPYDFHIPMASLPMTFRLSKESFAKAPKSFLKSDAKKADKLKNKILNGEDKKLIGISWKTASKVPGAIHRQINLANLASHLSKSGARLINLQYGDVKTELSDLKKVSGIEVLQVPEIDNSKDLDGLAALITACDEVVSTSNATVHLAGALGCETKALIPLNRAWWWGISDTRSYWYKSVQLHRQNRLENWSDVIERL